MTSTEAREQTFPQWLALPRVLGDVQRYALEANMRYPPGMLPEILDAYERDDHFFASVRLLRGHEDRVFELGITRSAYLALHRVFQARPFEQIPGSTRRYFFVPSVSKREDPERCIGTIRIEQGGDGKQFEFEMPSDLIANMLWFFEMKTLAPAQHLQSWAPDPGITKP